MALVLQQYSLYPRLTVRGNLEFPLRAPGRKFSDADIAGLNIPTGMPLLYRLDSALKPTVPGGEYLDPEAAAAAAAAVANQGR